MSDDYREVTEALSGLYLWVRRVSIEMIAHELLIREKLGVTEEEWEEALSNARAKLPEGLAPDHSPLEGFAAVIDYLKRVTER